MRQGEVLVLHLLHQQQDTHQHLDRPNLADQAEHHLRRCQCVLCYNITCSHGSGACQRKPAQYVGKVGHTRPCRQRCTEHRGAVTHHWDTGVGDHFNLPGHDLAHFNFLPFERVRSTDPFVIEARESYWIEKYRVLEEGGMNRRR